MLAVYIYLLISYAVEVSVYAVGGESMCGEVLRGELVVCRVCLEIFQAAPCVATVCWLPMMVWQSVCFLRRLLAAACVVGV